MPTSVVSFDAGQTLIDLDLDFLAMRLGQQGITVSVASLEAAAPSAWQHYDRLTAEGALHPWHQFMARLLGGAGAGEDLSALIDWLYAQQATHNLWRRPIRPMVELAAELRARGARLAVLSNSEGHLAELLAEIDLARHFDVIIDSAVVGVAKPDPRIFQLTLERLGVTGPVRCVHIGDSWSADVEGALGAGWNAIWYRSRSSAAATDPRVPVVTTADETRAALASLGA